MIASIVFRQLSEDKREGIVALLRDHPRFEEDFVDRIPWQIKDDEDATAEWLLQQASIWPDIARGYDGRLRSRFHRSRWHFVNMPVFLDAEAESELGDSVPSIEFHNPGGVDFRTLNVVQAIQNSLAIAADHSRGTSERAIHVAWLFHLVEDVHQPCHAATLYSIDRFPGGDRGGNLFKTQTGDLHATWDGLFGWPHDRSVSGFRDKRNEAIQLLESEALRAEGEAARLRLAPLVWANEGRDLAEDVVYTDELRSFVRNLEIDGVGPDDDVPEFELTDEYLERAKQIAEVRAVQAGYRLAELLKRVLSGDLEPVERLPQGLNRRSIDLRAADAEAPSVSKSLHNLKAEAAALRTMLRSLEERIEQLESTVR